MIKSKTKEQINKKALPAWRTAWWSSKLSSFGKTSPHWEQAQTLGEIGYLKFQKLIKWKYTKI